MSADNGIYILKSPKGEGFEWRVIHAQAIENITWDSEDGAEMKDGFNILQLKLYYDDAPVFTDEEEALALARQLEDEILKDDFCPILEYGVSEFESSFEYPLGKSEPRCECGKINTLSCVTCNKHLCEDCVWTRDAIRTPYCERCMNDKFGVTDKVCPNLLDACLATLMFHSGGDWSLLDEEWKKLTGGREATTKALCDYVRAAIATA